MNAKCVVVTTVKNFFSPLTPGLSMYAEEFAFESGPEN